MEYIIGCDAHKHYSQFAVINSKGELCTQTRINHEQGALYRYLSRFPRGTPVALESIGNWYWIMDEIESSGCKPVMAHAVKAKVMMGHVDKTDKLDARGLATLLHNGALPIVWIAPAELRDERQLHRTRMWLCKQRTALKNRIHATLAKYNLLLPTKSNIFAPKWRTLLDECITLLPPETARCLRQELELLENLQAHIRHLEDRMHERLEETQDMQLLKSMPGIGEILALVIEREVGDIKRFPSAPRFASYAGTVPTTSSSGGKTRHGRMRKQANQYLKWAFIEAANVIVLNHARPTWRSKHVVKLYKRIRSRKGHAVAIGAVARHLSEAAYWILRRKEVYRDPTMEKVSQSG